MQNVVLVTGAARGIGAAIVANLGPDHRVVGTWRSRVPDQASAAALFVQADLRQPEAAQVLTEAVIARFGRLDALVLNAGVIQSTPKDSFDAAQALELLQVNLVAPGLLLRAALPHLRPGAAVVSIPSINAVLPPRDAVFYGASKAGLNLWTRAMAKELGGQGIRVNAVAPGAIETPDAPRDAALTKAFVEQTTLARIGTPQDVAKAVRFLLSAEASFITGEVLTVSGGYRL